MKIKSGRETTTFNGIEFFRYPSAKNFADRYYFRPHIMDTARGVEALHREIWKFHYGPIPQGCDIHHKDLNPLNNNISNLECLTQAEHRKQHKTHRVKPTLSQLALDRAKEWHHSLLGYAWHVQHGHETAKNRKRITKTCDHCGKTFESWNTTPYARFCSNKCKSAWRRKSHKDDVEQVCEYCGKTFKSNKYDSTRFCSKSCARSDSNTKRHHAEYRSAQHP